MLVISLSIGILFSLLAISIVMLFLHHDRLIAVRRWSARHEWINLLQEKASSDPVTTEVERERQQEEVLARLNELEQYRYGDFHGPDDLLARITPLRFLAYGESPRARILALQELADCIAAATKGIVEVASLDDEATRYLSGSVLKLLYPDEGSDLDIKVRESPPSQRAIFELLVVVGICLAARLDPRIVWTGAEAHGSDLTQPTTGQTPSA